MKVCKNLVCQIAVTAAYLSKEIDADGLANHPCRDMVKLVRNKPHVNVGTMGKNSKLFMGGICMPSIVIIDENRTADALIDEKEALQNIPCMPIHYYPPPPMFDLPKRKDNNFRHHGKGTYNKFNGRR